VFSLNAAPPQPQVLGLSVAGNSNVIRFTGTSGIEYDVQRSTDLASWTVLATISAQANGSFSHTGLNAPQRAAFYQLRQHLRCVSRQRLYLALWIAPALRVWTVER